jgi:hypothetical protein
MALGIVHIAGTPLVYPAYAGSGFTFLYMFLGTGAAVIFAGLLALFSTGGWERGERWAWAIQLRIGVFLLLLGIGAVIAMTENPFAYLMLIVAAVAALPVWVYRKAFTTRG